MIWVLKRSTSRDCIQKSLAMQTRSRTDRRLYWIFASSSPGLLSNAKYSLTFRNWAPGPFSPLSGMSEFVLDHNIAAAARSRWSLIFFGIFFHYIHIFYILFYFTPYPWVILVIFTVPQANSDGQKSFPIISVFVKYWLAEFRNTSRMVRNRDTMMSQIPLLTLTKCCLFGTLLAHTNPSRSHPLTDSVAIYSDERERWNQPVPLMILVYHSSGKLHMGFSLVTRERAITQMEC